MENLFARHDDWELGTIFWYAVVVWFSASLLSQALYMALYGIPYDAVVLLKEFGPVYYLVLLIEATIWIGIGVMLVLKCVRKFSTDSPSVANTV